MSKVKNRCINMLQEIQKLIGDYYTCVSIDCLLSQLMSIDELCWIPISKSVPEEKGYYLTTTIHGSVYCDHWDGDYFDRSETIIAWMPLPQPYKWEDNENE